MMEIATKPSPPMLVACTEQPRTAVAVQTTLPLFDAPADKPTDKRKEAFVWDEAKGLSKDWRVLRTDSLP
ncbi:MAG TPA: hypothetical protein VMU62_00135, partial [Acidobacteriaceae bacterium]|nr:hypothetical protein [Acidobacteriaceae bacterium]